MGNYNGYMAALYAMDKYNFDKNKEREEKIEIDKQASNTANNTYNITIINNTETRPRINPVVFL